MTKKTKAKAVKRVSGKQSGKPSPAKRRGTRKAPVKGKKTTAKKNPVRKRPKGTKTKKAERAYVEATAEGNALVRSYDAGHPVSERRRASVMIDVLDAEQQALRVERHDLADVLRALRRKIKTRAKRATMKESEQRAARGRAAGEGRYRKRREKDLQAIAAESVATRRKQAKKNPSKKSRALTKKDLAPVVSEFKSLVSKAAERHPEVTATRLEASPEVHDTPRHYAMAGIDGKGPVVTVAPELAFQSGAVIRGVIAHELGHVLALIGIFPLKKTHDASERQADKIAEDIFKQKIFYTKNAGVQCMGRGAKGVRPRPKGLK